MGVLDFLKPKQRGKAELNEERSRVMRKVTETGEELKKARESGSGPLNVDRLERELEAWVGISKRLDELAAKGGKK